MIPQAQFRRNFFILGHRNSLRPTDFLKGLEVHPLAVIHNHQVVPLLFIVQKHGLGAGPFQAFNVVIGLFGRFSRRVVHHGILDPQPIQFSNTLLISCSYFTVCHLIPSACCNRFQEYYNIHKTGRSPALGVTTGLSV